MSSFTGIHRDHSISIIFSQPAIDLKKALIVTLNDGLHIYRQALSWNRPQRIKAATLFAIGGMVYAFDQKIHDLFTRDKESFPLKVVHEVGNFFEPLGYMGFTNKYYAAGLIFGYFLGWNEVVSRTADLLESYLITGGIKNAAHFIVGRRRPAAGARGLGLGLPREPRAGFHPAPAGPRGSHRDHAADP